MGGPAAYTLLSRALKSASTASRGRCTLGRSMTIEINIGIPIKTSADRLALVRGVLSAHPSDEAEWVEWKTRVPLERAEGRFEASRHILGFANRSPIDSGRFLVGQAHLLIGIEPGKLVGTPRRDPAQLHDWLGLYLGLDGPAWDAHYVGIDDKEILVLEVQPPLAGDPIWPLRRDFERWHAGSIFVRHKGKTDPATPADVAMLSARAAASKSAQAATSILRRDAELRSLERVAELLTETDCSVRALIQARATVGGGTVRVPGKKEGSPADDYINDLRIALRSVQARLETATASLELVVPTARNVATKDTSPAGTTELTHSIPRARHEMMEAIRSARGALLHLD